MILDEVLKKSEGKTLEFKREISSATAILKTVVAFANTSGGTLLIGVEDKTRKVCGISDPLKLEERLASLIIDSISPHLVPEIEILPWRKTHVISVQVYPSSSRPHYLKSLGPQKGSFVRLGSTNRVADAELIEEMRRFSTHKSYDEQSVPFLNSEAIDFRAASELYSPFRSLKPRDRLTLHLTTLYQGREIPTVGGFLLFGKNRTAHFPDAWIQAGLFDGNDKQHILDTTRITHYLPLAIEETIVFIQRHISRGAIIKGIHRKDQWSLPLLALREALINAVVHADYSQKGAPIRVSIFNDRIEIENPGMLPFGLTIEDIQEGISKTRNRIIGRIFHDLGLIEQWGSGIQRMTAACRESGLRDPLFEEIGNRFRVTLSMIREKQATLDEIDQSILEVLKKNKNQGLSTREISETIQKSTRSTRTRLLSLIVRGVLIEIGSGPNDPRRRYFLAEDKG